MRTMDGFAWRLLTLVRRWHPPAPPAPVRTLVARRPLLSGEVGEQRHAGWRLDQVDGTTCGSAVLLALAAWADPEELARLEGDTAARGQDGFGPRYDARQRQLHRETNRFWPMALGTSPFGMLAWLHRNVPAAGRYAFRPVDDVSAADVAQVVVAVEAALDAGRPVPLLVGAFLARHWVLLLGRHDAAWRVYEPQSGSVRMLDVALIGERRLADVLGWNRLHAALLPR